ncbi:MAG: minor capsid protein, partial [Bacteroidales bacterium]|nr:minor capsid protein [Bacteroidales bacterium]
LLKIGEDEYKNLVEEYDRAIASLQRSIENFYYRFAEHNKVSYLDAKRILDKRELKEFQWTVEEYIERGIENALDQRWMDELENASIRIRISRLESLQYQIRQQVELITARRLTSMAKVAEEIMHEGYYKSIYEIQKGFGISDYFNVLDEKTVENTISKPWTPDGKDFSERIWGDRDKLVAELEKELTHSFIRGDAPDQAINNIARVMNTSKKHAGRLVMTESAYFASASRVQAYKELGVEEYRVSATLDLKTSKICQEMDGKVFKISEYHPGVTANPFHPWCRTSTIPHFEGNIKSRFMRDPLTGKSGSTGEDISYKDWYQKYVVDKYGQEQVDIMRKKLENETSDFEQYQRYKKLLGDDMPAKSFAEFQELKYNKVDEWRDIKGLYRYLIANPESNKEYYSVNKGIKKLISEGKVPETIGTAVKPIPVEFLSIQKHALKRMEQRNVTEADARSYINNASVMFKQSNGLKNMYYSHAGAAAVAVEEKLLVTVFPSSYYDKGAEGIMEVLKNHGK